MQLPEFKIKNKLLAQFFTTIIAASHDLEILYYRNILCAMWFFLERIVPFNFIFS